MSQKEPVAFECKNCRKIVYPKHAVCPDCRGREFAEVKLGNQGRVLTYVKLYAVPEGVSQMPLVLGIVEFDNGVRVTGQITSENVKLGDKMRPAWGFLRKAHEKELYGFRFEPSNPNALPC